MTTPSESMVGLSGYLDRERINFLITSLTGAWLITMGGTPGTLQDDLRLCRRWFDPVAQGQRLRKELAQLDDFPGNLSNPGNPFTVTVDSRKWLVTPEGRCALDLLTNLPTDQAVLFIDEHHEARYDRILCQLYRDWSRHRLDSVISLLAGTTKPLQIPAAGVVIALMVNGNDAPSTALMRFASDGPRELVDNAFFTTVNAFADILSPGRRGNRSSTLISGWMLYEARRRLGSGLMVEDFHGSRNGRVWVPSEHQQETIEIIARDLTRGHRPKVTSATFSHAFDALVEELRRQLPRLAGFGLSHEQPTETRRLRNSFIESMSRQSDFKDET
jgi:hypothetical protein